MCDSILPVKVFSQSLFRFCLNIVFWGFFSHKALDGLATQKLHVSICQFGVIFILFISWPVIFAGKTRPVL